MPLFSARLVDPKAGHEETVYAIADDMAAAGALFGGHLRETGLLVKSLDIKQLADTVLIAPPNPVIPRSEVIGLNTAAEAEEPVLEAPDGD